MTSIPVDQTPAVNLSQATAITLADGIRHPLAESLGAVLVPAFTDPLQTGPDGLPVTIAPGDSWIQFVDVVSGVAFAAPFRSVVCVELSAPVALSQMPELVKAAIRHAPQLAARFPGHEALAR